MLAMVTGSVGFAPNPIDGLIFFAEPARPLAATIVDNAEGLSVAAARRHPLRDRRGAPRSRPPSLSFGGWYIRRRLRRYTLDGDMSSRADSQALAPAAEASLAAQPAAAVGRGDRPLVADGQGRARRGVGRRAAAVRDRRRDRHLHARARHPVREHRRASESHPIVGSTTETDAESTGGGFKDPIIGTLMLTALGTLIAFPIGVATAVWLSEYGRPALARASRRVRRRDRRRHPDDRARDLRAARLHPGLLQPALLHRRGRRRLRPLLLHRRDHDVADRAAADRRGHARGAAVDPHPRPRGLVRPRQGQDLDDPAGPASRGSSQGSRPA